MAGPRARAGARPTIVPRPTENAALLGLKDYAVLLSLARSVARAVEHADVASIVVEEACRVTGAARAELWELARVRELRLVAQSASATPRCANRVVVRASSPEWDAVRTREPVWLGSREDARARYPDARVDPAGAASRCEAWAFLPCMIAEQAGRVLVLAFTSPRSFDAHDRAFLCELAAGCADALARGSVFTRERVRADAAESARAASDERSRRAEQLVSARTHLYERERFARGRAEAETAHARGTANDLERMQAILGALAAAADGREISTVLATSAPDAFGAFGFAVTRRVGATELETIRTVGFPDEVAPVGSRVRIESSPEGEVLRSGAPLWIESRDEIARRYPGAAADLLRLGSAAWLGVPVASEAGVVGTLALTFCAKRTFSNSERVRLIRLALQCAAALERGGGLRSALGRSVQ